MDGGRGRYVARDRRGLHGSAHPAIAAAGATELGAGGNAVDAAVAVVLTSLVAEPLLTGLARAGTSPPEGRYRAYFRDPAGKQRSETFRIKKDATAFLAEMETSRTRGTYVSPHPGRTLFGDHAEKWMAA
jgi:hypothetical protein